MSAADDRIYCDGLRPYPLGPQSRQERIEVVCAMVWRLRQIYGLDAVDVDWHEPGEKLGDPVATVTLRTDLDNLRPAE